MSQKHQAAFDEQELLSYTRFMARLKFKADGQPKSFHPRAIPKALGPKVDERMRPVFGVGGPNRACFKTGRAVRIRRPHKLKVNPKTKLKSYPVPRNEEIDTSVVGC